MSRMVQRYAGHVTGDTWSLVCMHLEANPRKVFMMVCSIKSLGWWLNDAWWAAYFRKCQVRLQVRGWEPHWFMREAAFPGIRPPQCKPLLRLVYGMFCSCCGCRFHHGIHPTLMKRLCVDCRHTHYISNTVLYLEYGLSLADVAPWTDFVRFARFREYI